uniref:ORF42 n=1 Tax=Malaco herpesvirus 4 TaxID=3031800 RepID=A0AA48P8Z9_9VIRU|nr:TPA_asm: ORF42 [Malaco herpesvirus 4]
MCRNNYSWQFDDCLLFWRFAFHVVLLCVSRRLWCETFNSFNLLFRPPFMFFTLFVQSVAQFVYFHIVRFTLGIKSIPEAVNERFPRRDVALVFLYRFVCWYVCN